ncbi:hypothetical protein [Saccharopolyspora sp. NPDC002686]|uniref:hypothetical protein n=1 Tax=Saccharopolyspora sp. NPDC002686 TaxID=3154541 RepID=UPI00332B638F
MTTMDNAIETASQSPVSAEHHGDNNYTYNYTQGSKKLLARSRYDHSWLSWLAQVFEPPTTYPDALKKLRKHRRIVITGEANSGLHTAATMLLYEAQTAPRLVTVESDLMLADYLDDRCGLLIDLRRTSEMSSGKVLDQLAALEEDLDRTSSRAVVIAPPESRNDFAELRTDPESVFWLDAPDNAEVLIKHLEAVANPATAVLEAIDVIRRQSSTPLHALLENVSPNRARVLAELIRDLGCVSPHQPLAELQPDITAGFHSWQAEVGEWYRNHEATEDRALFVALAALDGAPSFVIAEEAGELVRISGSTAFPPFAAHGLLSRLEQMHAQLHSHRLGFSRPGFADAIFSYVWLDQPWLRRTVLEWLSQLPARLRKRFAPELIDALSDRLLAVASEFNDPDVILDIARSWAPQKPETAARLLTNCALDPVLGRRTRTALKEWASNSPTAALAAVVASVCGGDLAQVDLQLCLTRLRYLTASISNERVAALGAEAVRSLAGAERTAPGVLSRVRSWCEYPASSPARKDGTVIFLLLAQEPFTRPALAEDENCHLRACWRNAMDLLPTGPPRVHNLWHEAVSTWLGNALNGTYSDQILAMLTSAAASSGRRAAQLEHAARRWADGNAARSDVLRDLLMRLRRVDPTQRKVEDLLRSFNQSRRADS